MVAMFVLIAACVNKPIDAPTSTQSADTQTSVATAAPVQTPAGTPVSTLAPTIKPTPAPTVSQHIIVIVFENQSLKKVLAVPYFSQLAKRGALLTNYHGLAHPSEPNYIAMISGDLLVSDDGIHNLPQTNLVGLLDAANVSWKAYLENYPGNCFNGAVSGDSKTGQYVRRHNPFMSFDDVRTNPQRCSQMVNSDQLAVDIAANQLPGFSFYVPNLNNDGHDMPLAYAAKWLSGFLDPKLSDPGFRNETLVVVTFDEASDSASADDLIYTVLLGPMVRTNTTDAGAYSHYNLLRTIEDNFGLGSLNRNDATAVPFAACNFSGGCKR
jgi:hypothetical protein